MEYMRWLRPALVALSLQWFMTSPLWAVLHQAPIVMTADQIRAASRYPVGSYRLYQTTPMGEAVPIPFQIDEVNEIGDHILDQGPLQNASSSNRIFDGLDELAFMGNDVGPIGEPKVWPNGQKPHQLFEIRFTNPRITQGSREGAVYLAVYQKSPPATNVTPYVMFDQNQGRVTTSRYQYDFDTRNYLVVRKVSMFKPDPTNAQAPPITVPLLDSSTFFLKGDFKYFLTVTGNHRSINSQLEAWKSGPVRTIVRVAFTYSIMKINFSIGMYTEISFLPNSVILPAVIQYPIDGRKVFNKGSGFYYGFALTRSPNSYEFSTNMNLWREPKSGIFNLLESPIHRESKYWLSLAAEDHMMYVELLPSRDMLAAKNVPFLYRKDVPGGNLRSINNDEALPIEKAPVNMGLAFDLTRFAQGEHFIAFQLFFENKKDPARLDTFRHLSDWQFLVSRINL